MNLSQVNFALVDIKETLAIWRNEESTHPYVAKLLREWDAMLDLKSKLERRR